MFIFILDLNHLVCKIEEFEPPTQEQVEECIEFMEKAVMNRKVIFN
jgi:protein-tyrosine phosphatase